MAMPDGGIEPGQSSINDEDRDSLSVLPLVIIPFETRALKRTRMIKNSKLESVIELFSEKDIGKGHIYPHEVDQFFSEVSGQDNSIIMTLAELKSYDVYSLRVSLRKSGIEVDDVDALRLSDHKQAELQAYMQPFLKQMTINLFGDESGPVPDDWREMFMHPDVKVTRRRLATLSKKLGIPMHEVPRFLEDYGDVYLSVAYYQQCLDEIKPAIVHFLSSASEILAHSQLGKDYAVSKTCNSLRNKVERISRTLTIQFAEMGKSTDRLWSESDDESFRQFRQLVESSHERFGTLLCALSVKMLAWSRKFPIDDQSGPMRRADFMTTEMRQGW